MRNNNIDELKKMYKPCLNMTLTNEEEQNLMKLAAEGNKEAQETLVKANMRFAFDFALNKVKYSTIDLEDLIQVCALGLVDASKHIKNMGNKFVTYAYYRMIARVNEAMAKSGNKTSLPIEQFKLQKKVVAIFDKHMKDVRDEKTALELTAKELDITTELVDTLLSCAIEYASYESIIEGDDDSNDFSLEDESTELPEEIAILEDSKEIVRKAVSKLDKAQRLVIENKFGLNGLEAKNYSEIGREFNRSRAWGSQRGKEALIALRNNCELQSLLA